MTLLGNRNIFRTYKPLAALVNLRYLDLRTPAADESLGPLHGLKQLEFVSILPAYFTKAEIDELRVALPNVAGNLHEEHEYVGRRVR